MEVKNKWRQRTNRFQKAYQTAKDFQSACESYFTATDEEEWTFTGLLLHLDISKETFKRYLQGEGSYSKFSPIAQWAQTRIAFSYEKSLRKKGRQSDLAVLKNLSFFDEKEDGTTTINLSFDEAFKDK